MNYYNSCVCFKQDLDVDDSSALSSSSGTSGKNLTLFSVQNDPGAGPGPTDPAAAGPII